MPHRPVLVVGPAARGPPHLPNNRSAGPVPLIS